MNNTLILRGSLAALAAISLGGCLGSSNGTGLVGGTGGGVGGGTSTYQASVDRIQNLGPQTVRQTGTLNYAGKTRIETAEPGSSTSNGFFVGDVNIAANFDNETLSGTATNFAGEVDGQAVTVSGTLSTQNTTDPNIVTQSDVVLPVVGGTVTQGNLIASMRGTLTESVNNQSSTAQLSMTGAFTGPNAEGATGTAALLLGDENAVGFGIAGGGSFYLEKQ